MEKRTRAPAGNPQPRKYSSAAKSPTITHRVRGGLYEKLKASAEKREVSLSEEIERRLESSFRSAADPYIGTALAMAEANCDVIQQLIGKNIAEDPYTRVACAKAAASAIELVGGLVGQETPEARAILQTDAEMFGRMVAIFVQATRDRVENESVKGIGQLIETVANTSKQDVESEDQNKRMLLAKVLREKYLDNSGSVETPLSADAEVGVTQNILAHPEQQPDEPANPARTRKLRAMQSDISETDAVHPSKTVNRRIKS